MRHRFAIRDWSLLLAVVSVVVYIVYDIDVFVTGQDPVRARIDFDELPIIGVVLCAGLLLLTWRRTRTARIEAQKRAESERHVRELAFQDPLTGLPNRRQFLDALHAAINAPPRATGTHALLIIDLNGFKSINDVYGHAAGDQALIGVGERLLEAVQSDGLVARLGGDEFAVLATHLAGPEAVTSLALRIIEAFRPAIAIGSTLHNIAGGIGITLFPYPGADAIETMRRADVALYRAKEEGVSSMAFFNEEMDRYVRERELMERELRAAMAADEIRPHFQPLVDLKTKTIIGFEALARWTHPTLGEVPPERFVPIAEDTGLIHQLSDTLLDHACKAASTWPADVALAFNISPVQLRDTTLGLRVLKTLAAHGLAPQRLELEITESALVRDIDNAARVLGALRDAGVRIALDDFGTGYSSLYHLRTFKVDKIKIDRSFVDRMHNDRESAEIVQALIGLGRGLGLKVTAEGIGSESQDAELLASGCGQGQGYLFGEALPAEETTKVFSDSKPAAAAS